MYSEGIQLYERWSVVLAFFPRDACSGFTSSFDKCHVPMFSGTNVVAVDSPVGRLGLTVCYDLRFPDLYQKLRFQHEAQVQPISLFDNGRVASLLMLFSWVTP